MKLTELKEFEPDSKQEVVKTLASLISKNCSGYLSLTNALTDSPKFLFRGVSSIPSRQNPSTFLRPQQVRQDRKPRDTHADMHFLMDEWLYKQFKFKGRSQGLFATGSLQQAGEYGEPCIIFPIKEFDYLYNEKISDLTFAINNEIYFQNQEMDPTVPMQTINTLDIGDKASIVEKVMNNSAWHFNEGFGLYLKKFRRNEITLRCPYGYYIVPYQKNMNNICWQDIQHELLK